MEPKATGDAIPRSGLKQKAFLYVEHVTGKRNIFNFVHQGFIFLILKQFPTILGTFARPILYRKIMGNVGNGCLIEKSVRFEIPSRMFINNRVFIGENCWISAGSIRGEITFGDDSFIAHSCTLTAQGGSIQIGKHVHVSRSTYINGIGDIEIGDDTLIGPNVVMISGNHPFDRVDIPIRLQGVQKAKITIGKDVWLSANTTIVPGVTIGDGCVIGAGAVVTKDIPPYSIAAGVPARVVNKRKAE